MARLEECCSVFRAGPIAFETSVPDYRDSVSIRISDVHTEWLRIPLSPPIADSTHRLNVIDLIVVEVRAGDHCGHSYMLSFDYGISLLKGVIDHELKRHVVGCAADDIRSIYQQNLQLTEYIGNEGVAMWGISAIDVALWDLLARRLEVPASILFGRRTNAVRVYGSGGWISYSDEDLVDEVSRYVARGFAGVKIKIGSLREDRDIERIRAVRAC